MGENPGYQPAPKIGGQPPAPAGTSGQIKGTDSFRPWTQGTGTGRPYIGSLGGRAPAAPAGTSSPSVVTSLPGTIGNTPVSSSLAGILHNAGKKRKKVGGGGSWKKGYGPGGITPEKPNG